MSDDENSPTVLVGFSRAMLRDEMTSSMHGVRETHPSCLESESLEFLCERVPHGAHSSLIHRTGVDVHHIAKERDFFTRMLLDIRAHFLFGRRQSLSDAK
jgi:hypothetical protein